MIQFLKGVAFTHPALREINISGEEMFDGYGILEPKAKIVRPQMECTMQIDAGLVDLSALKKKFAESTNRVNVTFKQKVYRRRHKKKRINKKLEKKFGKRYFLVDKEITNAVIKQIYGDQIELNVFGDSL